MWQTWLNVVGVSLLLISGTAHSAYRCIKDGQTYFSDRQCGGEQQKITIRADKPATNDGETSLQRTKRYLEALADERAFEQKKKKVAAEHKQKLAKHKQSCTNARISLKTYQEGGRLYYKTDDGGRDYIDEETRLDAIKKLQRDIKTKCRGT